MLIEGRAFALQTVAAYIDLDPVRANLCRDPKDYRFCGYAEAIGSSGRARRGIQMLSFGSDGKTARGSYRMAINSSVFKGTDAIKIMLYELYRRKFP